MAGKFINTKFNKTVDNLVTGFLDKLDNPYYVYNDQSPSIVDYYNINIKQSSLDESLRIEGEWIGPNSPIRYNKIRNMVIYGVDKIVSTLEYGEFGAESSPITGECVILYNTFEPLPGDHFFITYLNTPYLFRVTEVTNDTFENGANLYKIQYIYMNNNDEGITKQVVEEYEFIIDNVGTDMKAVIKSNDYKFIEEIEQTTMNLKELYKNFYYNERVDSFTYVAQNGHFIYDQYLTEFLIRNKILSGSEYIFISQNMMLDKFFPINYNKTIFSILETMNLKKIKSIPTGLASTQIIQPMSNLCIRKEKYDSVSFVFGIRNPNTFLDINDPKLDPGFGSTITYKDDHIFITMPDGRVVTGSGTCPDEICSNLMVSENGLSYWRLDPTNIENGTMTNRAIDIVTLYLNNKDVTDAILQQIADLDYKTDYIYLYYEVPIIVYCLEQYIKKLLIKQKTYS